MNLASNSRTAPVVFAIACLCVSACGDGAATQRESFVAFWTDSSAYCDKVAGECAEMSRAECQADWPKAAEVERAIDRAKLDSNDLQRCQSAGRAEDTCYRAQPCAAFRSGATLCAKEDQRVQLDCAGLLKALDLPDDGSAYDDSAGHGDTSSAQPGTSGEDIGKELCDRAAECATEPVSAGDLDKCVDQVNLAFTSVLPDPHAVLECLKAADCSALQNDGAGVTRDCIDVDADATHCLDSDTLHICNGEGACRNIKCADTCEAISATAIGCGLNETDGYDKCQCALE